jgi:hypothetical protein
MPASIGATALQVQFDTEYQPQVHMRAQQENVVVPISRRLRLVELTERTCKWPNGDPLSDDFSFCGNDPAETGPYCKYHSKLAFQPGVGTPPPLSGRGQIRQQSPGSAGLLFQSHFAGVRRRRRQRCGGSCLPSAAPPASARR